MEKNSSADACTGCGLDRRSFLSMTILATAAAAVSACAEADMTAPVVAVKGSIKISDHAELANVGGVATFTLDGSPIAVVRTAESTFVVLSRICPHQGSTVNSNGNGFTCPNHGAMFNKTGGWVGGQPTSNMRTLPVTFNATANTLTIV